MNVVIVRPGRSSRVRVSSSVTISVPPFAERPRRWPRASCRPTTSSHTAPSAVERECPRGQQHLPDCCDDKESGHRPGAVGGLLSRHWWFLIGDGDTDNEDDQQRSSREQRPSTPSDDAIPRRFNALRIVRSRLPVQICRLRHGSAPHRAWIVRSNSGAAPPNGARVRGPRAMLHLDRFGADRGPDGQARQIAPAVVDAHSRPQ